MNTKPGKFLQRLCAMGLAVITVCTYTQFSSLEVEAAINAAGNIRLKEKIGNQKYVDMTMTTVVAGGTIQTNVSEVQGGDYLLSDPPFTFVKGSVTPPITEISGDSTQKTITVHEPLPAMADEALYNVTPSVLLNLQEGFGVIEYDEYELDENGDFKKDADGNFIVTRPNQSSTMTVKVSGGGIVQIGMDSTLSFETESGSKPGSALSFLGGIVTDATGTWKEDYRDAYISSTPMADDGSFTVTVRSKTSGSWMVFDLTAPSKIIYPKSKFKISFTFAPLTPLTLKAVSPEKALKDVGDDLGRSLMEPSATGEKIPYLVFDSANDDQNAVTGNFKLLGDFYKYNEHMKIVWSVDPGFEQYVVIGEQVGKTQVSAQLQKLPTDDTQISLTASIQYAERASGLKDDRKVKLTLLGTGTKPKVEVNQSYKGKNVNNEQKITETNQTTWPKKMEVYDGNQPHIASEDIQDTWSPFKVDTSLFFGSSRGKATHAKIYATGDGEIEMMQDGEPNGSILSPAGVTIQNKVAGSDQQITPVSFVARKKGSVDITIEFYTAKGLIQPAFKFPGITIEDHSPNSDATLRSMKMTGKIIDGATADQKKAFNELYPRGIVDYGFLPEQFEYNVTVGHLVDSISLHPIYNYKSQYVQPQINITYSGENRDEVINVPNDSDSALIPLREDTITKIQIKTEAEDGSSKLYTISITRAAKSIDASLESLVVTRVDNDEVVTLTPKFDTKTMSYKATVPYTAELVDIVATANDSWAVKPSIESDNLVTNALSRIFKPSGTGRVKLNYDDSDPENLKNTTDINIVVRAEDGTVDPKIYTLRITRLGPSHDTKVKTLKITRDRDQVEVKLDGKGFDPSIREYFGSFPYSTEMLSLSIMPNDILAREVLISTGWNGETISKKYVRKDEALAFTYTGLGQSATPDPKLNTLTFKFWVIAEDGWALDDPRRDKNDFYTLTLTRSEPDTDASLKSLTVVDTTTSEAAEEFVFNPQLTEYNFNMPFSTEQVTVTPVASKPETSTVTVNGSKITPNMASKVIKLESGKAVRVEIVVTPESGNADARTYVLNITRSLPGAEARLKALDVGGFPFKPDALPNPTLFDPAKTSYKVEIPKGTKSFTVTATAVDPKATIKINDKAAVSGTAFGPIESMSASGTIKIVVTAQDGKTTKTYTVSYKDWNYINPSADADLSDLIADYGDLEPAFIPNIEEYEIYLKPDASKLTLTPKLSNKNATLEVSCNSKKLTVKENSYSSSILEDETTFTIDVTAEDGTTKKTYTVTAYRNDEEKQGDLKPITPDSVDFESSDPIVIDISKYSVISAEVFNTLKTDYSDKTILFKGNDYSLELYGGDLNTQVPYTESFDLKFSFRTPDEQEILDLMEDIGDNDNVDPVYLYFDHHGTLPAEMLLTVSLGREYRNEKLYWNYYNQERTRIDYYGYVNSNAKGTFSVPISHFSTYLITDDKIDNAENKSGTDYSGAPDGTNLNNEATSSKTNPSTGQGAASNKTPASTGRAGDTSVCVAALPPEKTKKRRREDPDRNAEGVGATGAPGARQ